jgi:hypothetical protein
MDTSGQDPYDIIMDKYKEMYGVDLSASGRWRDNDRDQAEALLDGDTG